MKTETLRGLSWREFIKLEDLSQKEGAARIATSGYGQANYILEVGILII